MLSVRVGYVCQSFLLFIPAIKKKLLICWWLPQTNSNLNITNSFAETLWGDPPMTVCQHFPTLRGRGKMLKIDANMGALDGKETNISVTQVVLSKLLGTVVHKATGLRTSVLTQVHSQHSNLPGKYRAVHISFSSQALWRCWFYFSVGFYTCPHCQRYQKLVQWPWWYCTWWTSKPDITD